MGISGLLPLLKSIARPVNVKNYAGKSVAIDGYSWLHKGAYGCAMELCQGLYTDRFVTYFVSRLDALRAVGVEPVVVFDGGPLSSKSGEEESRRSARRENRSKALAHLAAGNRTAAEECFQRSVDVTPEMAKQVIEALKERNIRFIVAPYEADAQMAHLALSGDVWAVLTEDSDLLVYGCPRVLFKLDKYGNGEEVLLSDLHSNQGASMAGFTHDMFMAMGIMAGCDFLPNLPGIAIKKAHQLIKKFQDFTKVCKSLRFGGTAVPRDYEVRFQRALWVFRHQRVFCTRSGRVVHLRPLPEGGIGAADVDVVAAVPEGEEAVTLPFLGAPLDDAVAVGIASGELHPFTHQPFDLHKIYRGCTRLPRHLHHLAPQLGLPSGQAGSGRGYSGGSGAGLGPGSQAAAERQQQHWHHRGGQGSGAGGKRPHSGTQQQPATQTTTLDHFFARMPAGAPGALKPFVPPRLVTDKPGTADPPRLQAALAAASKPSAGKGPFARLGASAKPVAQDQENAAEDEAAAAKRQRTLEANNPFRAFSKAKQQQEGGTHAVAQGGLLQQQQQQLAEAAALHDVTNVQSMPHSAALAATAAAAGEPLCGDVFGEEVAGAGPPRMQQQQQQQGLYGEDSGGLPDAGLAFQQRPRQHMQDGAPDSQPSVGPFSAGLTVSDSDVVVDVSNPTSQQEVVGLLRPLQQQQPAQATFQVAGAGGKASRFFKQQQQRQQQDWDGGPPAAGLSLATRAQMQDTPLPTLGLGPGALALAVAAAEAEEDLLPAPTTISSLRGGQQQRRPRTDPFASFRLEPRSTGRGQQQRGRQQHQHQQQQHRSLFHSPQLADALGDPAGGTPGGVEVVPSSSQEQEGEPRTALRTGARQRPVAELAAAGDSPFVGASPMVPDTLERPPRGGAAAGGREPGAEAEGGREPEEPQQDDGLTAPLEEPQEEDAGAAAGGGDGFHGTGHMERFTDVARSAVQGVESSLMKMFGYRQPSLESATAGGGAAGGGGGQRSLLQLLSRGKARPAQPFKPPRQSGGTGTQRRAGRK